MNVAIDRSGALCGEDVRGPDREVQRRVAVDDVSPLREIPLGYWHV